MNIFATNPDPYYCAKDHCDKHVLKMIVETTQLLSTAVRFKCAEAGIHLPSPGEERWAPYKATHHNHPSTLWARRGRREFLGLMQLGVELCKEYTYRYGGKIHKCENVLLCLADLEWNNRDLFKFWDVDILDERPLSFARAYPPRFRMIEDVHHSYRLYVAATKRRFATWKKVDQPPWWEDACAEVDRLGLAMDNLPDDGVLLQ